MLAHWHRAGYPRMLAKGIAAAAEAEAAEEAAEAEAAAARAALAEGEHGQELLGVGELLDEDAADGVGSSGSKGADSSGSKGVDGNGSEGAGAVGDAPAAAAADAVSPPASAFSERAARAPATPAAGAEAGGEGTPGGAGGLSRERAIAEGRRKYPELSARKATPVHADAGAGADALPHAARSPPLPALTPVQTPAAGDAPRAEDGAAPDSGSSEPRAAVVAINWEDVTSVLPAPRPAAPAPGCTRAAPADPARASPGYATTAAAPRGRARVRGRCRARGRGRARAGGGGGAVAAPRSAR